VSTEKTYGWGVENRDDLEQVVEEDVVEEVGIAILETVEEDILLKTGMLAPELPEDALGVVSGEEIWGNACCSVYGHGGHCGTEPRKVSGEKGPGFWGFIGCKQCVISSPCERAKLLRDQYM
jgi:hypothetical protein